jgi:hypothetical protein
MGWSGGSSVMNGIIDVVHREIKDPAVKQRLYKGIIEALEGSDWDTQEECLGQDIAFDAALAELYPDWASDWGIDIP